METSIYKELLIVKPSGMLDTLSAPAFGEEVRKAHAKHPDLPLVIDFSKVEMLTSMGIREILTCKKQFDFTMTNVNHDVFAVLELTGLSDLLSIKRKLPEYDVTGRPVLGKGKNGAVYYLSDELVIKVFIRNPDVDEMIHERITAKKALVAGIPTAISYGFATAHGKPALVFELVKASSLSKKIEEDAANIDHYLEEYVEVVKKFHTLPKEVVNSFLKVDMCAQLHEKTDALKEVLSGEELQKLHDLITTCSEKIVLMHGDIQPGNVMATENGLVFIDMDTISQGAAIFDIAYLYRSLVGFEKVIPGNVPQVMGISADTAKCLYERFVREYYKEETEAEIQEHFAASEAIGMMLLAYKLCKSGGLAEESERAVEILRGAIKKL